MSDTYVYLGVDYSSRHCKAMSTLLVGVFQEPESTEKEARGVTQLSKQTSDRGAGHRRHARETRFKNETRSTAVTPYETSYSSTGTRIVPGKESVSDYPRGVISVCLPQQLDLSRLPTAVRSIVCIYEYSYRARGVAYRTLCSVSHYIPYKHQRLPLDRSNQRERTLGCTEYSYRYMIPIDDRIVMIHHSCDTKKYRYFVPGTAKCVQEE